MDSILYDTIKNLKVCECGSSMFTLNVKTNIVTCNRCLRNRLRPVGCDFKSKIRCGTSGITKKQAPSKSKHVCSDIDKKIKIKYNAMIKRTEKSGRECCRYDEFKEWYIKTPDECFYCGGEFKGINKKDGLIISIDRKDNKIGYLVSNMVKACYVCNSIKNQYLSCGQMKAVANLLIELRKRGTI